MKHKISCQKLAKVRNIDYICRQNVTRMNKRDRDILYFISFCIEQYKMHKGLLGSDTMKLFDNTGVTNYLIEHFDVLHTQGAQWLIQDIDEYITNRHETISRQSN